MEPETKNKPDAPKQTVGATAQDASKADQSVTDKVAIAARAAREQLEDRGAEMMGQAKEKVSQVYDQANKNLTEQYEKAIGYSQENPGKTVLIVFSIGVAVGLTLANSLGDSRSRRGRVVEPVLGLVSTLAREYLR